MSESGRKTLPDVPVGWEAFPDVRQVSRGPHGCLGVVERPSRMTGSGRVAVPDFPEWSVDPPGCPAEVGGLPDVRQLSGGPPVSSGGQPRGMGMVGTPSLMSLKGRLPFRMSSSCQVTLPYMRETLPVVRWWSADPLGCPGVVERPSWMSGCGRETLLDVREWSGGPPGCSGVVGKPSWKSGRPSRMSGSGRETLLKVRRPSQMFGSG